MTGSFAALGDSVIKGVILDDERHYTALDRPFVAQFARRKGLEAVNLGRFGSTVTTGLLMLERYGNRLAGQPFTLLEFGGNDCNLNWLQISREEDAPAVPQVDLEDFTRQYLTLIARLQGLGTRPVMLTLPPLEQDRFFAHVCRDYDDPGRAQVLRWMDGKTDFIAHWHERYNLRLFDIAARASVPLIDITSAFFEKQDYGRYICADGIHPNQAGHDLIADVLGKMAMR